MYCVARLLSVALLCLKGSYLAYGAKCAGQKFDDTESFCCGSTIHRIDDGGFKWNCCRGANKPYSNIEKCCGSEVQKNSQTLGCCKNKFYDTSTDRCCEGKLHRDEPRPCCGRGTFNPSNHLCCGSELYDRQANMACCGNRVYNKTITVCIGNNRVVKKGVGTCRNQDFQSSSENNKCCEGGMIDTQSLSSHLCCYKNQIFPKSLTHYCDGYKVLENHEQMCGKEIINSNNMMCCNNVSHVKKYRRNSCCGARLIDASKKGCCNKKVSYRLGKRKCCGVKVIRKNQQCCGGSVLRVRTHVCCNNTDQVKKLHGNQNQCCGNTPFDNTSSKCNNGRVVSLTGAYCGGEPMHADKDLCCDNSKLFKNAKKTKKCCAGRAIKASCRCCQKSRRKCCGQKTKSKILTCQSRGWYSISDLMEGNECLKQAFVVKKRKNMYQQKKQLLGRKQAFTWKLDKSCKFINKKKFIIVETSGGDTRHRAILFSKKNRQKLKTMKETCNSS